jgi:hypothetical protein
MAVRPSVEHTKGMQRDEFSENTKRVVAARVAYRCSNPECTAPTAGPQVETSRTLNVGVAAHISAAAPGGPRYDPALSSEQRSDIANAIWLCQNCAKLIDNDAQRFNQRVLAAWKELAEAVAQAEIGKTQGPYPLVQVQDKWVDSDYPTQLGITKQLETEGFRVNWRSANEEAKLIDIDGWEYVIMERDGVRYRLKVHDHPVIGGHLVLLKKRAVK